MVVEGRSAPPQPSTTDLEQNRYSQHLQLAERYNFDTISLSSLLAVIALRAQNQDGQLLKVAAAWLLKNRPS